MTPAVVLRLARELAVPRPTPPQRALVLGPVPVRPMRVLLARVLVPDARVRGVTSRPRLAARVALHLVRPVLHRRPAASR
jgi:hypothetical protein